ncbi:hypothetical protein, partial [Bacillus velezensis]|uniref:hypothetical protein n=1 Tax=Bacillus velezensis TaxID=492670 RepID=UPI001C92F0B8
VVFLGFVEGVLWWGDNNYVGGLDVRLEMLVDEQGDGDWGGAGLGGVIGWYGGKKGGLLVFWGVGENGGG